LDYYESLIVPLVEADPVTFQPTWFTKINVLWAYLYLERFGASISSDYLIASGFEMDSGRGLWVLFPQPV
jgi:hypothetical protein